MRRQTELNVDGVEWRRVEDSPHDRVRKRALWRSRGVVPIVFESSEAGRNGDQNFGVPLVSTFEKRLKPVKKGLVEAGRVFQPWLALGDLGLAYAAEPFSISKSTLSEGSTEGHRPHARSTYPSKTTAPNGLVEELPPKNRSHKVLA